MASYTAHYTLSTDSFFLAYNPGVGIPGSESDGLYADDEVVPEGAWTAFVSPYACDPNGGIGLTLLLESGGILEFLAHPQNPDDTDEVIYVPFEGRNVTLRVEHYEDGTLVFGYSYNLMEWFEVAAFEPSSPVSQVGVVLRYDRDDAAASGQLAQPRLLTGIWENVLEEVWLGPPPQGRPGPHIPVEPTVQSTDEPLVHAIVGAQFGDLEFDVGKSVRWVTWYVDNLFVLDVNLGTHRYWIVNWAQTFPDAEHSVTGINYFVIPAEFRKEQWRKYKMAFGEPHDDDWILWVDAHEGFSVDNRSLPDDYDFAPFKSFLWREIQRAQDAGQNFAILPYYVFLRSDHITNVTYQQAIEDPDDRVQTVLQALSVPYYQAHQGQKRLWNAAALKDPNFDWSQIDTPVAPAVIPNVGSSVRTLGGAYIEGPDLASIVGATKLTVEVDVSMDDWTPTGLASLVNQTISGSNSWTLNITASLGLSFFAAHLVATGAGTNYTGVASAFADGSRHTLSVTWRANNGSLLSDVQFKRDGVAFGSVLTAAVFPTGLVNSTSKILLGRDGNGSSPVIGNFYGVKIYVNDVLVASPNFTSMQTGQTSVTDAQGNVWTLRGTAAVVNPVAPPALAAKAQIISYGYAHWNLQDIEPPQTTVPELTEANDDGWRMRKLLSKVRPIPGLPVGDTWIPPEDDPAGLPGPWAPADYNNPDPLDPETGAALPPPVPPAPSLEGIVTPLYDCVFRINMRDGVWYEEGLSGNIPLKWDEASQTWTTDYDPEEWADHGVKSYDPTAVPDPVP